MDDKERLRVIVGSEELYFTFLTPPQKDQLIDNNGDIYEITNVAHKQTVTRKPTEEECEKMNQPSTVEKNQFQISLIEVEKAETIVYAKRLKNL